MTTYPGKCDVCGREESVRHLELYPNSSKGCRLCHGCAMLVTQHVRDLRAVASYARLDGFMRGRQVAAGRKANGSKPGATAEVPA